mmetsp:Transcript_7341/g.19744  ORF Transcript_7341/g.19744 Transcript_7341/m.19744 type:complete len:509 (+) Transcript_7341:127-1653(+)
MAEAMVCASCPEAFHDRAYELCKQHGIQKAFGKAGDMVNSLSGRDWIPKWEAKVVMATVTKAQTIGAKKALIICIAGGKNCDAEMARQPDLVRAIKKEMEDAQFRVRVEWIEIQEFLERYDAVKAKGKSEGKGRQAADQPAANPEAKGKGKTNGQGKAADANAHSHTHTHTHTEKAAPVKGKGKNQEPKSLGKGDGAQQPKALGKEPKALGKGDGKGYPGSQPSKGPGSSPSNPKAEGEKQKQPQENIKPLCQYFAKGECKNGAACRFSHHVKDSKPPCKFFQAGQCKNGTACLFSHKLDDSNNDKASQCPNKHQMQRYCAGDDNLRCSICHRTVSKGSEMWGCRRCLWWVCQKCSKGQVKAKQSAKDTDSRVLCGECGKSFKDWGQVCDKHFACKGQPPLCMCSQCSKVFDGLPECAQHQKDTGHEGQTRVNDTTPPASWECVQCEKEFATEQACLQHMRAAGHGWPCCQACCKRFGCKKAILQHQQSTGHCGIEWLGESDGDSSSD